MAFVGALSSIWSVARVTEERQAISRHPLQSLAGYLGPNLSSLSNPHDLGGYEYAESYGGPWVQAFKTNGGATIRRYYFCFAMDNPNALIDVHHYFFPHYNAKTTPANGRLSVTAIKDSTNPTSTYGLSIYEYNAAAWGPVAGGATATTVFSMGTIYYGTLEVDMSGGTGNHVVSLWAGDATQMMNSGNPYVNGVALTNDAIVTATPSIRNFKESGGKGAGQMDAHSFEVAGQDDTGSDTTRIDYYGAKHASYDEPFHVFTGVTSTDVAGGVWTPANQAAPACASQKRRTLDDPFCDEDGTDDHIYVVGDGSDKDQQFEMNDDYHVVAQTPTIYGLHVVSACHDWNTFPTHNLAHCPSEGGSVAPDAGVPGVGGNAYCRWGQFYELTPGSNAWSESKLDEFRMGVRNDHASETRYAYHLFTQILGTHLKRPANAAACPAAGRRWPGAVV